jgi:DNA-directed RNA polymerase specialized sigma24 family protein
MLADLPPTRWSVVARAGAREGESWTAALDQLVTEYRPVLVRYLCAHMRLPPDHAEDLVQAFLADRLLDRNVLRQAAREKGRLRSFLLKVFGNFVIGQLRRERAHKRRPASSDVVALDDLPELASGEASLADAFDTVWARQILARTMDRMRDECRSKDRRVMWDIFEARVLGPLLDQGDPMPYEQLVERFGLRSPSEASNLLITAKRMFVRVLHAVVRETVAADRDVEAEIRELKRVLGKW